jgi:hypothetical protein
MERQDLRQSSSSALDLRGKTPSTSFDACLIFWDAHGMASTRLCHFKLHGPLHSQLRSQLHGQLQSQMHSNQAAQPRRGLSTHDRYLREALIRDIMSVDFAKLGGML